MSRIHQFMMWLMRPVLDVLIGQLDSVRQEVARLDREPAAFPPVSYGFLMAWEAVCYSAEKFDRDTEQHGVLDRRKEVIAWACAYMNENRWPIPDQDVLATLLVMRDHLQSIRTVSKYQ